MAKAPFPQYYPDKWSKWLSTLLEWSWVNMILGALALIVGAVLITISTGPTNLPGDLALSLIVLAMTITATGMDALKEYQADQGKETAQWLRRGFIVLLLVGPVLGAVNTPSDFLLKEQRKPDGKPRLCRLPILFVQAPWILVVLSPVL